MMTDAAGKVEWRKKNKIVWRKYPQQMADINFYCLNIIEQYNYNMSNVDIEDQFRGSYRINKWMRKRKW